MNAVTMPSIAPARGGRVSLYYERTGAGTPVLLIMGLGMNASGWWRTVEALSDAGLMTLAFDARGMGRSSSIGRRTSTAHMADEAVAVLDAAGEADAHVYGLSLGGMVAQQVALRHPSRVRSLVLGATHAGGLGMTPADARTRAFFARRAGLPPDEAVWASVPYNYAPRTRERHPERIGQDVSRRLSHPPAARAYRVQLAAAVTHDVHRQLPRIGARTLVVHGERDRMVPFANARTLVDSIPAARLLALPDAGHLYPTDEPEADRAIADFLLSEGGEAPVPRPAETVA